MIRVAPFHLVVAGVAAALLAGPADGFPDASIGGHRAAPPPVHVERALGGNAAQPGLRAATTEYSHGDPSDDEQLFLELMNRARLDPAAEAERILADYDNSAVTNAVDFFLGQRPGVEYTRNENHDAFVALPAVQPLAFNALLAEAAHKHSVVMRTVDLQVHQAVGEPSLGQRVTAEAYDWAGLGESIFAFVKSMVHAHAGFSIDWGQGIESGNSRPATGHRNSLMNVDFVECGIGVIGDSDPDTDVGPQLITIDFAKPRDGSTRFVTGVVYDDRNGNSFYDPGEGLPGVRIETDASNFFAISSTSGGYAVPVPPGAGETVVFAGGQKGTPGEVVGSQESRVTIAGENVKVDFGPLPEPPLPIATTIDGASGGAIADGADVTDPVAVGELSAADATIGDIHVRVAIAHGAREELRVTLTSPSGTDVVLFGGAPGGRDLRGTFDDTLAPAEPLSALIGEPYEGTWQLRVTEQGGGEPGGSLESWSLVIRPGWIRPLHAPASSLAVKTLKVKDSSKPGKDKVIVKADLDAGGALLDAAAPGAGQPGTLRLLDAASGAEFLAVDLPDPVAEPVPGAPAVKAKLDLNRSGSSRGFVVLKVSGLDFPGPVPAVVRVELALGGVIVAADVVVAAGKSTGVAGRRFFVDAIKSKDGGGGLRSTVVKGRFAAAAPIGAPVGAAELSVGTARFTFDGAELTAKGAKLVRKSGVGLRKLVIDTAKGTFSAKIESDHALLVDGVTPIVLRIGDAFYGRASVRPYAKGTKTIY